MEERPKIKLVVNHSKNYICIRVSLKALKALKIGFENYKYTFVE